MTAMNQFAAGQIVLTAISPYVVGVFPKRNAGHDIWTYATGTPIDFGGARFLLTAAHVLADLDANVNGPPDDIVFLPPPPGGFLISELTDGARYAKSQRWDLARCIGNKDLDLAAILFNTPPQVEFFALLPDAVAPRPATQVAICGYPFAKSKAVAVLAEDRFRDLALLDFQCATVLEPASASGLRWCQFAVDYPSIPGIVNPRGYSGSMVWYDRAGCGTLEELGERLSMAAAGVVTDYIGPKQSLRCTKIDLVIEFIKRQVMPSI
jgi:hypothetical protein